MSDFGREAVARANALGMMVDISHASDNCMRDALAVSKAPIIASYSSARALVDHKRNITDEILRAIAAQGCVIQAVAYTGSAKADPASVEAEAALPAEAANLASDADSERDKPAP